MLIAFKFKLALACVAGLAGPLAAIPLVSDHGTRDGGAAIVEQTMVELHAGTMPYRMAGDFTRGGKPTEAPMMTLRMERPLAIMTRQVSSADYQACVDEGACRALDRGVTVRPPRGAGELV